MEYQYPPIYAVFSKSKNIIKKKSRTQITAWSTCHQNKLLCKVWYESNNKCNPHRHLGACTPTNATFSKSKFGLKIVYKIWYYSVDECGTHKHLHAYREMKAKFSMSKHDLKIEKKTLSKTWFQDEYLTTEQICMQVLLSNSR